MSLTSVNEELRRRLTEAQSSLLETREENLKKVGEFKQLENEVSSRFESLVLFTKINHLLFLRCFES